jgi:hypothetical protein
MKDYEDDCGGRASLPRELILTEEALMIEYLRFRWRLWRWRRQYIEDERRTEAAVAAAKARGAGDQIDEIWGGSDAPVLRYKVRRAMSDYLIAEADRLLIPLPDKGDEKIWENPERYPTLTKEGINQLRAMIRAERKARMELFVMWVPGVVGVLGALIGLASILVGKK